MRVLMLVTDSYGGFGGISQYNRDFMDALCSLPGITAVEAIPRIAAEPLGPLPAKLTFDISGVGSMRRFVATSIRRGLFGPRPDVVICGHLNLLPLCAVIARARGAKLILQIHGIDAWQQPTRYIAKVATAAVDQVFSVSRLTLERYRAWANVRSRDDVVLPNMVHVDRFGMAPKARDLEERLGLVGRTVIMTFGRLAGQERAKGFDEIITLMPALLRRRPDLKYMIAGVGDDSDRLKARVAELGLEKDVVFTGLVPEDRKVDYIRLADVYAMPSHGEGFGIVFLEAMACGIPVVASNIDGGYEAVREGTIGIAVDPADAEALQAAIFQALQQGKGIPDGLAYFSFGNFIRRLDEIMFG